MFNFAQTGLSKMNMDDNKKIIEPFLKWAGGKRWLVNSKQFPIPTKINRYFEPFLGGGALFFYLQPTKALLSDINSELIETFITIRDNHLSLISTLKKHHNLHSKQYYYHIRSSKFEDIIERAARFIYLNRTCWNGLYRVNLKGEFNVPIGTRSSILRSNDNFEQISRMLKNVDIQIADFEATINKAQKGDFVFADPPYTVKHNYNNFVKYNETIFKWRDQIRLKNCLIRAKERGVKILMTNADHVYIKDLYEDIGQYHSIYRSSSIAADSKKRKPISEALFTANFAV